MPLYLEPSETREGTRLPDKVVRQGKVLRGLEAMTGADFLIATGSLPVDDVGPLAELLNTGIDLKTVAGMSPSEVVELCQVSLPIALLGIRFSQVCKTGLLVQRKTGRDLANSVERLSSILLRMQAWTDRPWLLFVGTLRCNKKRMAVIDKRTLKYHYASIQGAVESWQLRGGYYSQLPQDETIAPWIARWMDKLRTLDKEKIVGPQKFIQPIVGPDSKWAWRQTLMSFPEVGPVIATRLAERGRTLAATLEWMTCPTWLDENANRPKNVTVRRVRLWRKWLGLNEDCLKLLVAAIPDGYRARVELVKETE